MKHYYLVCIACDGCERVVPVFVNSDGNLVYKTSSEIFESNYLCPDCIKKAGESLVQYLKSL